MINQCREKSLKLYINMSFTTELNYMGIEGSGAAWAHSVPQLGRINRIWFDTNFPLSCLYH